MLPYLCLYYTYTQAQQNKNTGNTLGIHHGKVDEQINILWQINIKFYSGSENGEVLLHISAWV